MPPPMTDQLSFSDAEFEGKRKRTRREVFLAEMDQVIPWATIEAVIEPVYPKAGNGRRPYPLSTMLRVHFLQQWYSMSDPAMEEALYEIASMRKFARLSLTHGAIPDETTILNFRHLLERNGLTNQILIAVNVHLADKGLMLRQGSIVDATIIDAPSSTKNGAGERDPDMHQTKKGNEWKFGLKAHIGVDAESGLVHTVVTTAANVSDVTQAHALVREGDDVVWADSGYRGVAKREEMQGVDIKWHIAMEPGKRSWLDKKSKLGETLDKIEKLKAGVRAKVEHPFRVIKRQFGFTKARYRGLPKNAAKLNTMFALSNLWMVRRQLIAMG
jgi:transposase, IS5 family